MTKEQSDNYHFAYRVLLIASFPIWLACVMADGVRREWPKFKESFKRGETA